VPTISGDLDRSYWQRKLQEAERELDAAARRTNVDAAASRLQRAEAALKALEGETAERPKRKPTRGRAALKFGVSPEGERLPPRRNQPPLGEPEP